MGQDENSDRSGRTLREMGWKPARKNYFPPPKDIPEYAARPLPPRPSSSSSSIYDSDQGSPQMAQHPLFNGAQGDPRFSTNFSGSIDESALNMVRPPSIVTNLIQPREQDEIASPQPRFPEHKVLKINTQDDSEVSPILTPPSGMNSHYQYTVSPLSPGESVRSFETAVSELDRSSYARPNSWLGEKNSTGTAERHPSQTDNTSYQTGVGHRPSTLQAELLHPGLQRINHRYSDPGSPVNPVNGIDSRNFGEPGPDVGSSARFNGQEERKVGFTSGKIDSFSHRTAASGERHPPPPLKLSERPLADNYVKTPFPPRTSSDYSQKSVFEEDDRDSKHSRRVSGISGFAKSLRPSSSSHKSGDSSSSAQNEARGTEEHSRASPVPIVKNILSKARSSLKIGSDDAKREKKRENLKRQIKVGTVDE